MVAPTSPTRCVEEEFAFALAAPWRKRDGWKALLLYLRGPADPSGLFSPLLTLLGIWRFKRRPPRIADVDTSALIGATVVRTSGNLGSYGMGGPGFVGVQLATRRHGRTWIVCTLWGAGSWLTLDGSLVSEGYFEDERRERAATRSFRPLSDLLGAELTHLRSDRDGATLDFSTRSGPVKLELRRDTAHLPPYRSGEARAIADDADLRDALVLSRRAYLWLED